MRPALPLIMAVNETTDYKTHQQSDVKWENK
jgi:hypothetical protein